MCCHMCRDLFSILEKLNTCTVPILYSRCKTISLLVTLRVESSSLWRRFSFADPSQQHPPPHLNVPATLLDYSTHFMQQHHANMEWSIDLRSCCFSVKQIQYKVIKYSLFSREGGVRCKAYYVHTKIR